MNKNTKKNKEIIKEMVVEPFYAVMDACGKVGSVMELGLADGRFEVDDVKEANTIILGKVKRAVVLETIARSIGYKNYNAMIHIGGDDLVGVIGGAITNGCLKNGLSEMLLARNNISAENEWDWIEHEWHEDGTGEGRTVEINRLDEWLGCYQHQVDAFLKEYLQSVLSQGLDEEGRDCYVQQLDEVLLEVGVEVGVEVGLIDQVRQKFGGEIEGVEFNLYPNERLCRVSTSDWGRRIAAKIKLELSKNSGFHNGAGVFQDNWSNTRVRLEMGVSAVLNNFNLSSVLGDSCSTAKKEWDADRDLYAIKQMIRLNE